jgi:hypothetical protein
MPSPYFGANVFPASYNIPSDGDDRDAASVNVGLEALGDRTQWLLQHALQSGAYYSYRTPADATSDADPGIAETLLYTTYGATWTASPTIKVDVPSCLPGDLLDISLHMGAVSRAGGAAAAGTGQAFLQLYVIEDYGGAGVLQRLKSSLSWWREANVASGDGGENSFAISGLRLVGTAGTARVGLRFRIGTTNFDLAIYEGVRLTVRKLPL